MIITIFLLLVERGSSDQRRVGAVPYILPVSHVGIAHDLLAQLSLERLYRREHTKHTHHGDVLASWQISDT